MKLTIEKHRDVFEIALLEQLKNLRKPVLGICHGAQIINVALGGSLYQDLPTQLNQSKVKHNPFSNPEIIAHEVEISKEAQHLFGASVNRYAVNSLHHQGIAKLGRGLSVIAKSDDGLIEGIWLRSHPFFVGVQWHPEMEISKYDKALIISFCKAVHGQSSQNNKSHINVKLL